MLVLQGSHQNSSTTNSFVILVIDILERVAVENHVFHKSCFVCAICNSWLNHFNYCFFTNRDNFYYIQHYQDIENACFGLGDDIRRAMGIGPGVQQQFKFTNYIFGQELIIDSSLSAFLINHNQPSGWR